MRLLDSTPRFVCYYVVKTLCPVCLDTCMNAVLMSFDSRLGLESSECSVDIYACSNCLWQLCYIFCLDLCRQQLLHTEQVHLGMHCRSVRPRVPCWPPPHHNQCSSPPPASRLARHPCLARFRYEPASYCCLATCPLQPGPLFEHWLLLMIDLPCCCQHH